MSFATLAGGDGMPIEPDWSSIFADELDIAEAHDHWGIVTREMQSSGTIAVANGHAIKRLVEFRVQYERSARQIAEHGPVLKAKRTKVPQYNLHWTVMRQADEAIRVLESELAIAPSRRGKATKVNRGKKTGRAADAYLKPVSK